MIYLNNAATSFPKAPGVVRAVANALEHPPADHSRSTGVGGTGPDCRSLLAEKLDCDRERVILCSNATYALNIALLGFDWRLGDRVLTTRAEHNSVLRPLYQLKKAGKIDYFELPVGADGRVEPANWATALKQYRPRLAVFTHASNVSGAVNDAETLCRLAAKEGVKTLVDASQTMGLLSVCPRLWGADMLAFTGHKYLLGPQGTGGLYIHPETELSAVFSGGVGIRSAEDEMPRELPFRLEAGTGNEAAFAGLAAALLYARENPLKRSEWQEKLNSLEEGMLRVGMRIIEVKGERTPVISAVSPSYAAGVLGEILSSCYDIICRTGLHCAPHYPESAGGTIRFSLSRFNRLAEIEETRLALEEIHRG